MKMKLKTIITIVLLIGASFGRSQSIDTSCADVEWIKIKVETIDSALFNSMIKTIEELTLQGKGIYFLESSDISSKRKFYPHIFSHVNKDSIDSNMDYTYPYRGEKNSFLVVMDGYYPFCDENDKDQTIYEYYENNPDSKSEVYVYPVRSFYEFVPSKIEEVRVRQKKVWNDQLKKFEFITEAITFYPYYGYSGKLECWLDLNKVQSIVDNENWINFFIEQKYNGYQYMQTNCAKYH